MRLMSALCKQARSPQNVNRVPFKSLLPLKLRNHVSGKSDRTQEVPCLQELTILFASLKTNEFDDSLCKKEIDKLQKTNVDYMTRRFHEKKNINEGKLVPGRNINFRQLNKFLKGYPNPP